MEGIAQKDTARGGPPESVPHKNRGKRTVVLIVLVFLSALTVRLVYLSSFHESPYYDVTILDGTDSFNYFKWGVNTAMSDGLEGVFPQSPLYHYFLALIFKFTGGGHLFAPRLAQSLIGAIVAVMVFFLGREIRGDTAGVAAALIFSFHGPMVFYELTLMRTGLIVFLNTLLVLLMIVCQKKGRTSFFPIAGFVFGLSLIAKPNIGIMLLAFPAWLYLTEAPGGNKQRFLMVISFSAGLMLSFSPVLVRNHKQGLPLLSMTERGPLELIVGNHPENPPHLWQPNRKMYELYRESGDSAVRAVFTVFKLYSDDPAGFIEKQMSKAGAFFSGYESPNSFNYYVEREYVPSLKYAFINWPALLGPCLVGLFLFRKRWKEHLPMWSYLVLYSGATIGFYVLARFRLPLVPVMAAFSGAALIELFSLLLKGRWKTALAAAAVAATISAFSMPGNIDPIQPTDYRNVARVHLIKGEHEKARSFVLLGLVNAEKLAITRDDAWSHYCLARMLFLSGAPLEDVDEELSIALERDPEPWLRAFTGYLSNSVERARESGDPTTFGFRL